VTIGDITNHSGAPKELKVLGLVGPSDLTLRLQQLGFIQGETIWFLGRTAFQGPFLVELRGVAVALRDIEARCLEVKWIDQGSDR